MTFKFRNKEYEYFYHPGNQTAKNERCMELPLAFEFAEKYKDIIEVGNVTRHYHREYTHDVVDLYEKSKWPIYNQDILNWTAPICEDGEPKIYKGALSVSTVEHTLDPRKAIENIIRLSTHYLITVPFGYASTFDLLDWDYPTTYYMKRVSEDNRWEQIDRKDINEPEYGSPYPFANYVAIITNED